MAFLKYLGDIWDNKTIRRKLLITFFVLAVYRLLIFIPVPFVDIKILAAETALQSSGGLEYFAMLLGGSLQQFSIIAVGLIPFINSSIILQLLTAVLPQLEELQEQGESGNVKIQQYTRRLSLPLAFLQSIGMVYFINYLLGGSVINTGSTSILLGASFVLTVGTIMLMWMGETITEKGISNGISLIIFANIIAGISSKIYTFVGGSSGSDAVSVALFMLFIVGVLIVLSVLLIKTRKEIPIIYARQGKVQETSVLPVPLNPVGMIPIIFSIAFVSFPYLLSQVLQKFGTQNQIIASSADWITKNFNIYTQSPSLIVVIVYFCLIVMFTFFYTLIVFNPDKMSDNIQKRGGFVPGIRPGEETAKYINGILMHLCLWGGIGLGFIGIYSYVLNYIPFIQAATASLGGIPVIVSGSGVIIVVGVVQELIGKINSELLMGRYDRI